MMSAKCHVIIALVGLLGLSIGLATGERYGRRNALEWTGAVLMSLPSSVTCYAGGTVWPAREDGVCYQADTPIR
jgi:hypothetical protein